MEDKVKSIRSQIEDMQKQVFNYSTYLNDSEVEHRMAFAKPQLEKMRKELTHFDKMHKQQKLIKIKIEYYLEKCDLPCDVVIVDHIHRCGYDYHTGYYTFDSLLKNENYLSKD